MAICEQLIIKRMEGQRHMLRYYPSNILEALRRTTKSLSRQSVSGESFDFEM
jgi:hypothetical protein